MNQLSLLEPQAPVETKPLTRAQAVLAALTPDGIEASEAGAIAHSLKQGRWAHSATERCKWCGVDGRDILRELAKQRLAVENRGRALWYPVVTPEPIVEASQFPAGLRRAPRRIQRLPGKLLMAAALATGVPTSTLARLLAPLITQIGTNAVADRAHISYRTLGRWRTGEIRYVSFEMADRIITDVLGEPALWRLDPELAAIYQED